MKLTYNILWFDDTSEYFDTMNFSPLEDMFAEIGFTPNLELVTTPDEFSQHLPFDKVDLIVVDYNLEEYEKHGQEFIELVREHQIYTEIIFYSNKPITELWQAIFDKQLEGVFVTNREGIINKIINISKQSVKKVLDIENMRGIVMSEVGDIDHILDSILEKAINSLEGDMQAQIYEKFHARAIDQIDNQKSNLDKLQTEPTIEVLIEHCDSYKRWTIFKSLCKRHKTLKKNEIGDYNEDILIPRNFLAHGKPRLDSDEGYIFEYRGKEYNFTESVGKELRKKILEYKHIFNTIHSEL